MHCPLFLRSIELPPVERRKKTSLTRRLELLRRRNSRGADSEIRLHSMDGVVEKNAADGNGVQFLWFDGHGPPPQQRDRAVPRRHERGESPDGRQSPV